MAGRLLVEREGQEDEGDEEEEVHRALDARLEDPIARGVEVKQRSQGGIRPGGPVNGAG